MNLRPDLVWAKTLPSECELRRSRLAQELLVRRVAYADRSHLPSLEANRAM